MTPETRRGLLGVAAFFGLGAIVFAPVVIADKINRPEVSLLGITAIIIGIGIVAAYVMAAYQIGSPICPQPPKPPEAP